MSEENFVGPNACAILFRRLGSQTRDFQNHLDALKGVLSLLANVSADLPGDWVSAGLTGDEHQISKPRGR
jgi:hypothetical protein